MPLRPTIILVAISVAALVCPISSVAQDQSERLSLELLQDDWERDPANLRVALLLGGMLRREGRVDEARSVVEDSLAALGKRVETEGDSGELQYLLGMGALFLDRNYVARERFQTALALQPEREEVHLGLVRSLLNLDKEKEAREALELARTLFPESEAVKAQLAELLERGGRYEEAIPILEELRLLNPESPSLLERLLRAYVATGQVEKAAPLFERLVEQGKLSELEAALQLFRINLEQGDLRAARVELQRAAQKQEDHPQVNQAFRDYYALQAKQAEASGSYRRAVLFWERASERVPGDSQTRYRLASAHAALNDHDKALALYLPLLEQRPSDPQFYADLSLTLIALDRLEAASRVIQLGYDLASASDDSAAMAQLRKRHDQLRQAARPAETPPASQAE